MSQASLFDAPPALPEGLRYAADFISVDEEQALLSRLQALPLVPFQFRGYDGRRRVHSFGWRYDFNGPGLTQAEPLPDWLLPLRDRAAGLAASRPKPSPTS